MIDPILPLSIAIAEGRGNYALFLGSGISKAAGIPTGEEILWDTLKRIYELKKEIKDPLDDELKEWFNKSQYRDMTYSDILEVISESRDGRRKFLEKYFKGKKPTHAHKKIAELIDAGFIKIVITTNFDRLMEKALDDRNVEHDTVASDSDLEQVVPREHSNCRILKIHGDYKHVNILNTEAELAKLDQEIAKELTDIFNKFGLVFVGYGGSDEAVLKHLEARKPRYGMYWLAKTAVNERVKEIIKQQDGRIIRRESADEFFEELSRKINIYLTHPRGDTPESVYHQVVEMLRQGDEIGVSELAKVQFADLKQKWLDTYKDIKSKSIKVEEGLEKLEPIANRLTAIAFAVIEYDEDDTSIKLFEYLDKILYWCKPDRSSNIGPAENVPGNLVYHMYYYWGAFSLQKERFGFLKELMTYKVMSGNNYLYLPYLYDKISTSLENYSHTDILRIHRESIAKYSSFFDDFFEPQQPFDMICQFDFILCLRMVVVENERTGKSIDFHKNFRRLLRDRFLRDRTRPLNTKLRQDPDFADRLAQSVFDEDGETFLNKLDERKQQMN